jgi:hypothetical protein
MTRLICLLVLVILAISTAAHAFGDRRLGIQSGWGDEFSWFIGLRAELEIAKLFENSRSALDFNYFFPGGDANYIEGNLNYLFPLKVITGDDRDKNFYWGAGLNVGYGWHSDHDDSDKWTAGMNALAGFNIGLGGHIIFGEGGYTFFSDIVQYHITAGFLF